MEDVIKEGEDDMGQNLLNIILAFNLHFHEGQDNLVLETLKERNTAQALTERLVFLLNREGKSSSFFQVIMLQSYTLKHKFYYAHINW